MYFASDNAAPAAPEVMEALAKANEGYASSYGNDEIMDRVTTRIRDIFEAPEAAVYLVSTGTTANALSLSVLAQPWQTVFCHRHSHIEEDECGAPEFFTGGAKLTLLDGADAKIDAAQFRSRAESTGVLGVHNIQRGALSITNVTEMGTVYTVDEISRLCSTAKELGIGTHLDGARFTNALVALGCTPAEMTWKAGIDVVSFGGTKNGLMGVEAVIIFDPAKAWEFELRRKRGGHLFSKHRYLSAQMEAYLTDDLWLKLARQANAAAARLEAGLTRINSFELLHPRQANMLFCGMTRAAHERAQAGGAIYHPWPGNHPATGPSDEILTCRLVCSWSTTDAEIDEFISLVQG
ncbi:threonine aldolase family protein [Neptunicoccus cionae]|uniref:threonine aldolase family protein n=1 Tax=Neptunicoccus cionae TaxID=2035344 RepID=UPI000C763518|nr:low specificity L-threonine aldolase [Amylibacter cionae]PLS21873.1 low specificity L-threonine aldolase [Amylibacter cionae]